jgi:hypothetical protein
MLNNSEYAEYAEYVFFYAALCIPREEYAEYANMCIFCIFCIFIDLYVLHTGKAALFPVGNTGTIPYEMRREAANISRRFLREKKQRTAKTVQVVEREQLGPQLGNKAMMK